MASISGRRHSVAARAASTGANNTAVDSSPSSSGETVADDPVSASLDTDDGNVSRESSSSNNTKSSKDIKSSSKGDGGSKSSLKISRRASRSSRHSTEDESAVRVSSRSSKQVSDDDTTTKISHKSNKHVPKDDISTKTHSKSTKLKLETIKEDKIHKTNSKSGKTSSKNDCNIKPNPDNKSIHKEVGKSSDDITKTNNETAKTAKAECKASKEESNPKIILESATSAPKNDSNRKMAPKSSKSIRKDDTKISKLDDNSKTSSKSNKSSSSSKTNTKSSKNSAKTNLESSTLVSNIENSKVSLESSNITKKASSESSRHIKKANLEGNNDVDLDNSAENKSEGRESPESTKKVKRASLNSISSVNLGNSTSTTDNKNTSRASPESHKRVKRASLDSLSNISSDIGVSTATVTSESSKTPSRTSPESLKRANRVSLDSIDIANSNNSSSIATTTSGSSKNANRASPDSSKRIKRPSLDSTSNLDSDNTNTVVTNPGNNKGTSRASPESLNKMKRVSLDSINSENDSSTAIGSKNHKGTSRASPETHKKMKKINPDNTNTVNLDNNTSPDTTSSGNSKSSSRRIKRLSLDSVSSVNSDNSTSTTNNSKNSSRASPESHKKVKKANPDNTNNVNSDNSSPDTSSGNSKNSSRASPESRRIKRMSLDSISGINSDNSTITADNSKNSSRASPESHKKVKRASTDSANVTLASSTTKNTASGSSKDTSRLGPESSKRIKSASQDISKSIEESVESSDISMATSAEGNKKRASPEKSRNIKKAGTETTSKGGLENKSSSRASPDSAKSVKRAGPECSKDIKKANLENTNKVSSDNKATNSENSKNASMVSPETTKKANTESSNKVNSNNSESRHTNRVSPENNKSVKRVNPDDNKNIKKITTAVPSDGGKSSSKETSLKSASRSKRSISKDDDDLKANIELPKQRSKGSSGSDKAVSKYNASVAKVRIKTDLKDIEPPSEVCNVINEDSLLDNSTKMDIDNDNEDSCNEVVNGSERPKVILENIPDDVEMEESNVPEKTHVNTDNSKSNDNKDDDDIIYDGTYKAPGSSRNRFIFNRFNSSERQGLFFSDHGTNILNQIISFLDEDNISDACVKAALENEKINGRKRAAPKSTDSTADNNDDSVIVIDDNNDDMENKSAKQQRQWKNQKINIKSEWRRYYKAPFLRRGVVGATDKVTKLITNKRLPSCMCPLCMAYKETVAAEQAAEKVAKDAKRKSTETSNMNNESNSSSSLYDNPQPSTSTATTDEKSAPVNNGAYRNHVPPPRFTLIDDSDSEDSDCAVEDGKRISHTEMVMRWDEGMKEKIKGKLVVCRSGREFEDFLKYYLKILHDEARFFKNKRLLRMKIVTHLMVFHVVCCYARTLIGQNVEDYLEILENVLLFIVHLELENNFLLRGSTYCFEYGGVEKVAQRIISTLCINLLNDHKRIMHVLMRLNRVREQANGDVMDVIYRHFLTSLPNSDKSDLNFVRYYLLFERWKTLHPDTEHPKMDRILGLLFPSSLDYLNFNPTLKKILVPSRSSCVEIVDMLTNGPQICINLYFKHVRGLCDNDDIHLSDSPIYSSSDDDNHSYGRYNFSFSDEVRRQRRHRRHRDRDRRERLRNIERYRRLFPTACSSIEENMANDLFDDEPSFKSAYTPYIPENNKADPFMPPRRGMPPSFNHIAPSRLHRFAWSSRNKKQDNGRVKTELEYTRYFEMDTNGGRVVCVVDDDSDIEEVPVDDFRRKPPRNRRKRVSAATTVTSSVTLSTTTVTEMDTLTEITTPVTSASTVIDLEASSPRPELAPSVKVKESTGVSGETVAVTSEGPKLSNGRRSLERFGRRPVPDRMEMRLLSDRYDPSAPEWLRRPSESPWMGRMTMSERIERAMLEETMLERRRRPPWTLNGVDRSREMRRLPPRTRSPISDRFDSPMFDPKIGRTDRLRQSWSKMGERNPFMLCRMRESMMSNMLDEPNQLPLAARMFAASELESRSMPGLIRPQVAEGESSATWSFARASAIATTLMEADVERARADEAQEQATGRPVLRSRMRPPRSFLDSIVLPREYGGDDSGFEESSDSLLPLLSDAMNNTGYRRCESNSIPLEWCKRPSSDPKFWILPSRKPLSVNGLDNDDANDSDNDVKNVLTINRNTIFGFNREIFMATLLGKYDDTDNATNRTPCLPSSGNSTEKDDGSEVPLIVADNVITSNDNAIEQPKRKRTDQSDDECVVVVQPQENINSEQTKGDDATAKSNSNDIVAMSDSDDKSDSDNTIGLCTNDNIIVKPINDNTVDLFKNDTALKSSNDNEVAPSIDVNVAATPKIDVTVSHFDSNDMTPKTNNIHITVQSENDDITSKFISDDTVSQPSNDSTTKFNIDNSQSTNINTIVPDDVNMVPDTENVTNMIEVPGEIESVQEKGVNSVQCACSKLSESSAQNVGTNQEEASAKSVTIEIEDSNGLRQTLDLPNVLADSKLIIKNVGSNISDLFSCITYLGSAVLYNESGFPLQTEADTSSYNNCSEINGSTIEACLIPYSTVDGNEQGTIDLRLLNADGTIILNNQLGVLVDQPEEIVMAELNVQDQQIATDSESIAPDFQPVQDDVMEEVQQNSDGQQQQPLGKPTMEEKLRQLIIDTQEESQQEVMIVAEPQCQEFTEEEVAVASIDGSWAEQSGAGIAAGGIAVEWTETTTASYGPLSEAEVPAAPSVVPAEPTKVAVATQWDESDTLEGLTRKEAAVAMTSMENEVQEQGANEVEIGESVCENSNEQTEVVEKENLVEDSSPFLDVMRQLKSDRVMGNQQANVFTGSDVDDEWQGTLSDFSVDSPATDSSRTEIFDVGISEVPEVLSVPQSSEVSEVSALPAIHTLTEVSEISEVPELSEVVHALAEVTKVPEIHTLPEVSEVSEPLVIPELPEQIKHKTIVTHSNNDENKTHRVVAKGLVTESSITTINTNVLSTMETSINQNKTHTTTKSNTNASKTDSKGLSYALSIENLTNWHPETATSLDTAVYPPEYMPVTSQSVISSVISNYSTECISSSVSTQHSPNAQYSLDYLARPTETITVTTCSYSALYSTAPNTVQAGNSNRLQYPSQHTDVSAGIVYNFRPEYIPPVNRPISAEYVSAPSCSTAHVTSSYSACYPPVTSSNARSAQPKTNLSLEQLTSGVMETQVRELTKVISQNAKRGRARSDSDDSSTGSYKSHRRKSVEENPLQVTMSEATRSAFVGTVMANKLLYDTMAMKLATSMKSFVERQLPPTSAESKASRRLPVDSTSKNIKQLREEIRTSISSQMYTQTKPTVSKQSHTKKASRQLYVDPITKQPYTASQVVAASKHLIKDKNKQPQLEIIPAGSRQLYTENVSKMSVQQQYADIIPITCTEPLISNKPVNKTPVESKKRKGTHLDERSVIEKNKLQAPPKDVIPVTDYQRQILEMNNTTIQPQSIMKRPTAQKTGIEISPVQYNRVVAPQRGRGRGRGPAKGSKRYVNNDGGLPSKKTKVVSFGNTETKLIPVVSPTESLEEAERFVRNVSEILAHTVAGTSPQSSARGTAQTTETSEYIYHTRFGNITKESMVQHNVDFNDPSLFDYEPQVKVRMGSLEEFKTKSQIMFLKKYLLNKEPLATEETCILERCNYVKSSDGAGTSRQLENTAHLLVNGSAPSAELSLSAWPAPATQPLLQHQQLDLSMPHRRANQYLQSTQPAQQQQQLQPQPPMVNSYEVPSTSYSTNQIPNYYASRPGLKRIHGKTNKEDAQKNNSDSRFSLNTRRSDYDFNGGCGDNTQNSDFSKKLGRRKRALKSKSSSTPEIVSEAPITQPQKRPRGRPRKTEIRVNPINTARTLELLCSEGLFKLG